MPIERGEKVHGWQVIWFTHPSDEAPIERQKPAIRLEKDQHWVETIGRKGIDRSILLERAMVEALKIDVQHAKSEQDKERAKERQGERRRRRKSPKP